MRRELTTWIWASVVLQIAGLAFDAVWHGLLHPRFKAETVTQMVAHLSTVHLLIYVGVTAVFLSTGWTLVAQIRRGKAGIALPVAFAGSLVSIVGEGWHAYTHLQLRTHGGPIAAATALFGLMVVVVALWLAGPRGRQRAAGGVDQRRAA